MTTLKWTEVEKNVFVVWNEKKEGIVYAPLHGRFLSADETGLKTVEDYLAKDKPNNHEFRKFLKNQGMLSPIDPPTVDEKISYRPTELMISLSNVCNLRCIYCYANENHNYRVLPWGVITKSIESIFELAQKYSRERVEISFHGTGETTVMWETFTKAIQFATDIRPKNIGVGFTLVTNGTMIDRKRACYLASKDVYVSVSVDGMEKIQNKQRPKANGQGSFNDVVTGIKELVHAGVRFSIRATVTGESHSELDKLVRFYGNLGCKSITPMLFSAVGRGSSGIRPIDPNVFVETYFKASQVAESVGVELKFPGTDIGRVKAEFCGANGNNFVVMPDGSVSTCSRVTKLEDPLSPLFFIGKVDDSKLNVDQEKIDNLRDLNVYSYMECEGCFAKYVCSGWCPHDRKSIKNSGEPRFWCDIVRQIIWRKIRLLSE